MYNVNNKILYQKQFQKKKFLKVWCHYRNLEGTEQALRICPSFDKPQKIHGK